MKPKLHKILETAVEQGVSYGFSRAHKHIENPSEGAIIDSIVEQVMNSLDEWFDFDDVN
jgi:hypothetical protein